jgi:AcrR family transcriptional regulator
MSTTANGKREKRVPLSRERVLRAAVAIADATGIGSLTMRSLARELGVKPMALYYHVANKEEILDGIVDLSLQ